MPVFTFTLSYQLAPDDNDHDVIVDRLGSAGLTDALVGTGRAGQIGLMFDRDASSYEAALKSAHADIQRVLPSAKLIDTVREEAQLP